MESTTAFASASSAPDETTTTSRKLLPSSSGIHKSESDITFLPFDYSSRFLVGVSASSGHLIETLPSVVNDSAAGKPTIPASKTGFVIESSSRLNGLFKTSNSLISRHPSYKNAKHARPSSNTALPQEGLSIDRPSVRSFRKCELTRTLAAERTASTLKVADKTENGSFASFRLAYGSAESESPGSSSPESTRACRTCQPDERVSPALCHGEPKTSRPSDFSIEHILRRAGPPPPPPPPPPPSATTASAVSPVCDPAAHYEWLHCTRYRPPKLLRCRKEGSARRKAGRNPRIPFSAAQAAVLEERFRASPYLGTSDVSHLATLLRLSDTRIKIWFQNRRARERRDHGKADFLRATPPPRPAAPSGPVKSAFKPPVSLNADSCL